MRPARSFDARHDAADHQHQALRAEGGRIVDRAPVVVERRAAAGRIGRREHAAPAQAGDRQPMLADEARGLVHAEFGELVAPRRDAAHLVARTRLDHLAKVPLLAHASRC